MDGLDHSKDDALDDTATAVDARVESRGNRTWWLARSSGEPDARPVVEDEPSQTRRSVLGTAPTIGLDGPGSQMDRRSIHEALFPELGAERVKVGRFELLRRLGRGGMGEVYVAYDEQLDREVAIKLLLRERSADDQARERLLREAQVLARLSHPNVVPVYEAGLHEGQVYLVMELVDGVTLRDWMDQTPEGDREQTPEQIRVRPWSEVLPVMIEAGRGLAAAHAAGLTHRDFKPDNVLVGSDGRVRVLDFGLARPGTEWGAGASASGVSVDDPTATSMRVQAGSSEGSGVRTGAGLGLGLGSGSGARASSGSRRGIVQLTEPGRVVGTLAYMSPEQLAATPLDARSDLYSFCVTLYEALYGERPFKGRTFAGYVVAVTQGKLEEPATRSRVPRWLRALVRRGLSVDPNARFASMDALLRELSRPRGRALRAGALAGTVALGSVGVAAVLTPDPTPPCEQADVDLATRWNNEARTQARGAFVAAEPSYGGDAAERSIAALDAHVDAWRAEQRDACEDTRARGTHTEEQLAQRTACIERNTALLRALLEALPRADAALVEHAHELVDALPEPVRCQDLDALGPESPEDPEAVRAVRAGLAAAEVVRRVGRQGEALVAADEQLVVAEATGFGPVHAEALVQAARSRQVVPRADAHAEASDLLWRALDLAELHDHHALKLEVWLGLLDLDQRYGRHERARLWAQRAEALLERVPAEPRLELELALRRGVAELSAGDPAASERWLRQGLDRAATVPGSERVRAQLWEALGSTLRRSARGPEAREAYERAMQQWRQLLGPEHPYLAQHALNLGLLLMDQGELDAARGWLTHAHGRWTALYGPEAAVVGRAELALANLEQTTGALDDALAHATRGRAIMAASMAPDDPVQVEALQVLGLVQFRRGALQQAHDTWQQALQWLLDHRGADDPDVLLTRSNLAEALLGLERYAEARSAYEALLPAARARAEHDPVTLMLVLKGLGLAALGTDRPAAAVPWLAEALALGERLGGMPLERADVQWALARAEVGAGEPRAAARQRAAEAARLYAEHGQVERADEVRRWLEVDAR